MDQGVELPDRGLRRNALGLPALVAQSLGVTAPEISAVVIAAVVASKVGAAAGFFAGWTVLAVGLVFVPALLVAAAFLLQNFFGLVSPHSATVLHDSWVLWAVILGVGVIAVSYFRHPAVRLGPAVAHGHRRDDAA